MEKKSTQEFIEIEQNLNTKLAQVMKKYNIRNLRLTSIGNSIAAGYSIARTTKPLLLRNESLKGILEKEEINLEIHNFSRVQNNCDEHVLEWLINNVKETEINKLTHRDLGEDVISIPVNMMTKELLDKYYPWVKQQDLGLKDAILETNPNMANIVIYNGLTGTFLDNITRDGNFFQKLTLGFNKDEKSLEAILKYIQTNNRFNDTATQVYLCGVPNVLGLGITSIINHKLKKIASRYANVIYITPPKTKFFYPHINKENIKFDLLKRFQEKFGKFPDINYDEDEYLELNNNIIDSINENYIVVDTLIKIDRDFYQYNKIIETLEQNKIGKTDLLENYVTEYLNKELPNIEEKNHKYFYDRVGDYLVARTPSDFYYLGKENMKNAIRKLRAKEETEPLYKAKKY